MGRTQLSLGLHHMLKKKPKTKFRAMMHLLVAFLLFGFAPVSSVPQNTSTIPQIINTAYSFLESHLCQGTKWGNSYYFFRPSLQKYSPDQWLWDSGSHMIVW